MAVICGTPNTGNDPGRADRPGADTDPDAVSTVINQAHAPSAVAILPPMTSICGKFFLTQRTRSSTPPNDRERYRPRPRQRRPHQQFNPLGAGTDTDCRTGEANCPRILVGVRVFGGLEDVFDGDQATQMEFIVDDQHAFQAMACGSVPWPPRSMAPSLTGRRFSAS